MTGARRWVCVALLGPMALVGAGAVAQDGVMGPPSPYDERGAVSTCLTLPEALAMAQRRGPEVSAARANAAIAQARLRQERGTAFPQVSAYARAADGDSGLVDGRTNTQTGLVLSQRLFDFGQSAARRRALGARSQAAMLETREAALDLQGDAGLAFLGILELTELVAAAERREKRFRALAEGLPRRLEAGLITIATASSIRAEIASARADRVEREASLGSARIRFASLVGERAEPCSGQMAAGVALISPLAADENVTQAIDTAPSVLAADARIDAARADIDVARRIQRPEISVQAVGAYQYDRLFDRWTAARRVGLDVSMPLFGGGSYGGERDEALARLAGAQAEADRERRDLAEQLRASLARADAFAALADAREDEVGALAAEVAAVRRQFDEGLRPYQEYELAEAALAGAEAEAIQAQYRALRERLTIAILTQSIPLSSSEDTLP